MSIPKKNSEPYIPSYDEVMQETQPDIPSFNEVMGEKKSSSSGLKTYSDGLSKPSDLIDVKAEAVKYEQEKNAQNNFGLPSFNQLAAGQQSRTDNTNSNINTKLEQQDSIIHKDEHAATKKANLDKAITNTAINSLKIKGIKPTAVQLNQEKQKYQKQVENNDASFALSPDGTPGLKRVTGGLENLVKGWHDAVRSTQANDDFVAKMDAKQKVDFLNKHPEQVKPTEYIGERPSAVGDIANFAGSSAPNLGKVVGGALIGAGLVAAAPETAGTSLALLPTALPILMTSRESAMNGAADEIKRSYSIIKRDNPHLSDVEAMEQAEHRAWAGGIGGLVTNAAMLSTGLKSPISAESKSLLANTYKHILKPSAQMAAVSGAGTLAVQEEGNLEGVKTSQSDIAKNVLQSVKDAGESGLVLTSLIHGVPNIAKSVAKFILNKEGNAGDIKQMLQENEANGTVPQGTTEKILTDLNGFKQALDKTPNGLDDQSKASVAGLIQKRTNIEKEAADKDVTAQAVYKPQIDAINQQIEDIQRTGKPLEHEIDEATGKPYKQPTFDDEAKAKIEDLADKISKGKRIEDAADLQAEANFPEELQKQLTRISKEEKSSQKDKENPSTDLSDNIERYLKKNDAEKEAAKIPNTKEESVNTEAGIDKNVEGKQIVPEESKGITVIQPEENTKPNIIENKPPEPPIENTEPVSGSADDGETTSIKNAVTGLRRVQLGLNEEIPAATKEFGTSWEEAKDKIDKGYNVQDLVDELKKKARPLTDVENALLLHNQNTKEIQLIDANKFINDAAEKGNDAEVVEGKVRKARILDELQNIYDVNKSVGTENARGLASRKMMVDRKYFLANMVAEKRATVNDGKPLTEEQTADIEKLHSKINETQEAFEKYVKEAEEEIKSLQEKILSKKVIDKKTAATKLRELADKVEKSTFGKATLPGGTRKAGASIDINKHVAAAMRLVADGLEKGGEIIELVKKAIEEIKKSNPEIDELKLSKAINTEIIGSGINSNKIERNKNKDFAGLLDRTAFKLKAENLRAKDAYDVSLKKDEAKKRSIGQKIQDTFTKWQRAFKLTNPVTMGKLGAAALTRAISTPVEDVVGGGYSLLFPKLSKGAIGEGGGLNVSETAKAYKTGMIEGMKDSYQIMKMGKGASGKSDLDVVFGKSGQLPPEAVDFFGQLHSATKAPIKRIIFERQLEKRARRIIANGGDISDPMVQSAVAIGAYKDASRAIFMQDNAVAAGWQRMVGYLETVDKKTGKAPSKPVATAMQWLMPFVKVPTNIAAEIGTNIYGFPVGVGKILVNTFDKGMENLSADEKDIILRNLKKGTLGLAALSLGYFNPQIFGGYYQDKERRNQSDAKAGAVKIGGINFPAWLIESPIFQAMQVGATVRRVKDAKVKGQTNGIGEGAWAGALGLAEHVPMIDQPFRIAKAISDPKERHWYLDELAKGTLEPAMIQKAAEFTDKDVKRNPSTLGEHLEMGIPGLRQNVPERTSKGKFK